MQQLQTDSTLQGGKYIIQEVLGQGGFGITYLAEHELLGTKVAIKEFFMKDFCNREDITSHVSVVSEGGQEQVARFREKFLKEARSIAKLRHPNIVRISDVFEENGTAYYVMDYCEGGSLSEQIKIHPSGMDERLALKYVRQVASALSYIHERRMMHLDVKPANILLDAQGNAVLIDFGLAKQYDATTGNQTSTTPVGISHGYAPIEQYKMGGVSEFSPATDVYSLGATLYYLITGQTPPEAQILLEEGLPQFTASMPVAKAIEQAMKVRRANRPQAVKDWLDILANEMPAEAEEQNRTTKEQKVSRTEEEKRLEQEKEQIRTKIKEKEDTISAKKVEIASNNKDKAAEEQRIAELQSQMKVCQSNIAKIEDKNTLIENEITALVRDITVLKTRFSRLDISNRDIEETVVVGTPVNKYEESLVFSVKGIAFTMRLVKAGSFMMGATSIQESYSSITERPVHKVTLTKDYYIGETLVTQELWKAVMGNNPSRFGGDQRPVERVTYVSCREFISRLNQILGTNFRFPTEAEWEYAARDGGLSDYLYAGSNDMTAVAWTTSDAKMTYPVKQKAPNKLGLYDMCGNVNEWCSDNYYKYQTAEVTDPTHEWGEVSHIIRGGSWRALPLYCRVCSRNFESGINEWDNVGLRLVLPDKE